MIRPWPSNWYCIILLNISNKKNTRWLADGEENKNHGVVNASTKCNNFVLDTIDKVFKYGDTVKKKHKLVNIIQYLNLFIIWVISLFLYKSTVSVRT